MQAVPQVRAASASRKANKKTDCCLTRTSVRFSLEGFQICVGAMPTSPHLAITNSPKVIVKSVRSAGSMWAPTPTRNRENLRESVGADDSVRPQKIRFLRKLSANSQLPLGGQGRPPLRTFRKRLKTGMAPVPRPAPEAFRCRSRRRPRCRFS